MNELLNEAARLSDPLVERLGWTLLHSVWGFALLALMLLVMLRLMRNQSAAVRYMAGCASLFAMPVLLVALWWSIGSAASVSALDTTSAIGATTSVPGDREDARQMVSDSGVPIGVQVSDSADPIQPSAPRSGADVSAGEPATPALQERLSAVLAPWLPTLVVSWLCGVMLVSLRPVVGWMSVRRLRRTGTSPVGGEIEALTARTAARLGVIRRVHIVRSCLVDTPVVVGWLRPLILLPATAITGLTIEQLRALLAHELAHVRRHDYLVNAVQTVVEAVLFYHPCVWWVSRVIRRERENCCDDLAVQVCRDRAGYAAALLTMDGLRGTIPSVAMSARGGALLERVRRLAGTPRRNRSPFALWTAGTLTAIPLVALFAGLIVASRANATTERAVPTERAALPDSAGGQQGDDRSSAEERDVADRPQVESAGESEQLIRRYTVLVALIEKDSRREAWLRSPDGLRTVVVGETVDVGGTKYELVEAGTRSADWRVDGRIVRCKLGKTFDELTVIKAAPVQTENAGGEQTRPDGAAARGDSQDTRRISGFVSRLRRSQLTLTFSEPAEAGGSVFRDARTVHTEKLLTGEDGRWEVTIPEWLVGRAGLAATVGVRHPGYVPRSIGPVLISDLDDRPIETNELFWLMRQMSRSALKHTELRKGRQIDGRVLTAAGEPAVNAQVTMRTKYRPYSWKFHDPNDYVASETVRTDSQGRFSVLADQAATLTVTLPGHAPLVLDDLDKHQPSDGDQPFTYRLPVSVRPRGRVLSHEGRPIPYAVVRADRDFAWNEFDMPVPVGRACVADEDGYYEMPPVPPGFWKFTVNTRLNDPDQVGIANQNGRLSSRIGSPSTALSDVLLIERREYGGANTEPRLDFRAVSTHTISVRIELVDGEASLAGRAPLIPVEGRLNGERWSGISVPVGAHDSAQFHVPRGVTDVVITTGPAQIRRSPDGAFEHIDRISIPRVDRNMEGYVVRLSALPKR